MDDLAAYKPYIIEQTANLHGNERIGVILTDMFWRYLVTPEPYLKPMDREDANRLLLGMLVNRGVGYSVAALFPERLIERLSGSRDIVGAVRRTDSDTLLAAIQASPALHRFPATMAKVTSEFAAKLSRDYDGDARNIWADELTGAQLEFRIRKFHGAGQKISSLLVRLLALSSTGPCLVDGLASCDISADRHAVRVFHRLGLIEALDEKATVLAARRLLPDSPCCADSAWLVGLEWCAAAHAQMQCGLCPLVVCCETGQRRPVEALVAAHGGERF